MAVPVSHIGYDSSTQHYHLHFVTAPNDEEIAAALYQAGELAQWLATADVHTAPEGERTVQFAVLQNVQPDVALLAVCEAFPPRYPLTATTIRITVNVLGCGAHTYVEAVPDFAPGLGPKLVLPFRAALARRIQAINMGAFVQAGTIAPSATLTRVITDTLHDIGVHVQEINPQFAYTRHACTLPHPRLN